MNGANYEDIIRRIDKDLEDGVLIANKDEPDMVLICGAGKGKWSGYRFVVDEAFAGWLWGSIADQEEYLKLSNESRLSRGLPVSDSFAILPIAAG